MAKVTPEQIMESTLMMARAILGTNALDKHKRDFLRGCVWLVTEAQGKYNVRYWSEGVYNLVQQHSSDLKSALKQGDIQHEHVYPRKQIAKQIMQDPACLEEVLRSQAIACLVTKEEHDRLENFSTGFDRYTKAGIRVWDNTKQEWTT